MRTVIAAALSTTPGVLGDPAPTVEVWGRAGDTLLLRVCLWHETAKDAIASAVIEALGDALAAAGHTSAVTHAAATPLALLAGH